MQPNFETQSQRYEKSSAKQRNSFIFLPRQSNFAIFDGKVSANQVKNPKSPAFYTSRKCILYFMPMPSLI